SNRIPRMPVGARGFSTGTSYSTTFPVRGSSFPRICSPKLAYQTIPVESTMTSWGCLVRRGRSYSVYITRVADDLGRASILKAYLHGGPPELKLRRLRYSA